MVSFLTTLLFDAAAEAHRNLLEFLDETYLAKNNTTNKNDDS